MIYTSFNAIRRSPHVSEKSVLLDLIKEIWTDRQDDSYMGVGVVTTSEPVYA